MPIVTTDRATLAAEILAAFHSRFPAMGVGVSSSLSREAAAVAQAVYSHIKAIEDADREWPPNPNSSLAALTLAAQLFGLASSAGGYGQNAATAAQGFTATLTGAKATAFSSGAVAIDPTGLVQLSLVNSVTISGTAPGTGSVAATFNAITTGSISNLPSGTVMTWQSPPAGADPTFTLTSAAATVGTDVETQQQLYTRLASRLQFPPKGGAEPDYLLWAQTPGVYAVYLYPRRGGTGTVHICVVGPGSGTARVSSISAAILSAAQAAVTAKRPISVETALVMAARNATTGQAIRVRALPGAKSSYAWDWNDGGTGYVVSSYTTGGGASGSDRVTLTSGPDVSLVAAIAAGKPARVQILSSGTGNTVVPVMLTAIAADPVGHTIDLVTAGTGFVGSSVSIGDSVWAGSSIATPIANAILAYIDSLGPSRVSGMADQIQIWDDAIRVAVLERIAQTVLDTDGTRFVADLVTQPTINGAAANYQGTDAGGGAGVPELCFAKSILVTQ